MTKIRVDLLVHDCLSGTQDPILNDFSFSLAISGKAFFSYVDARQQLSCARIPLVSSYHFYTTDEGQFLKPFGRIGDISASQIVEEESFDFEFIFSNVTFDEPDYEMFLLN